MAFLTLTLVLVAATYPVGAIRVGIIYNASLATFPASMMITNAFSCNECVCTMLNFTESSLTLSLNCYANTSPNVNCEWFSAATYRSAYDYQMQSSSNSTFYFQQLPSSIQSETTSATSADTSGSKDHVQCSSCSTFFRDTVYGKGVIMTIQPRIFSLLIATSVRSKNHIPIFF